MEGKKQKTKKQKMKNKYADSADEFNLLSK